MFCQLIEGGLSVDDRGSLKFCNGFNLTEFGAKRFYIVENNDVNEVRCWHSHLRESKAIICLRGSAIVVGIPHIPLELDDRGAPVFSPDAYCERYVLSAARVQTLILPAPMANGFRTLEKGTQLMIFSDKTLEESKGDDYRFPLNALAKNPFEIEIR